MPDYLAAFQASQTIYDAADNGIIADGSYTPPGWVGSLVNAANLGVQAYDTITGKNSQTPNTNVANPKLEQKPDGLSPAPSNSKLWLIIGAAVAGVLALVLFMRK